MPRSPAHIKTLMVVTALSCVSRTAFGEDVLMGLRLNGQMVSEGEVVSIMDDNASLPLALAHQLRLRLPADLSSMAPDMVPLNKLTGVKTHIDSQALVLDIDAPPEAFEPTIVQNYVPTRPADMPGKTGVFVNYNVLQQNVANTNLSSGLFSVGSSSDYGTIVSDTVANSTQGVYRLRSSLIKDSPEGNGSLTFGDSFLFAGALGNAFPFGGLQISSRSATSIDPQQLPFESILGQAAVPSTVDVYVNNALQSHQAVPTGPFVLDNIPVASGDGSIRVVVRDALGEERVITKSFYTSPFILPEGHSQYSFETGMLRQDYGSTSFDYSEPFASGTHRYGWTKAVTTEFHGEASALRQVAGEETSLLVAPLGTINIGGAVSNRHATPGALVVAGAESDTHPFTVSASTELASAHFTQLGYSGAVSLRQSSQARIAYDLTKYGSVSASLIRLVLDNQPMSNTLAVSYNATIPYIGYFGASMFDTFGHHTTGIVFSLSIPLGDNTLMTSQTTHDQSRWGEATQITQNVPDAGGIGFHGLYNRNDDTKHEEGGIVYRAENAQVTADAGRLDGANISRLGASGSLGFLDDKFFAAHETDGNFAMVDTNGIGGVHVYTDQQLAGVTDSDGKLVVPRLRAHEINRLTIDPADIPFDVTVPDTEKEIVPLNQTGYVVDFGLHRTHGATASLVLDDGSFVPAGTPIQNTVTGSTAIVGYEGITYLTNLTGTDKFDVQLANGSCQINVIAPPLQSVQPDLGKIPCHISSVI